jgi:hypothetical protein
MIKKMLKLKSATQMEQQLMQVEEKSNEGFKVMSTNNKMTVESKTPEEQYEEVVRYFSIPHADGIEVTIYDVEDENKVVEKGRTEEIRQLELKHGLKIAREFIWIDGAEDKEGIITLPYTNYSVVYYVYKNKEGNLELKFLDEYKEGMEKPYYIMEGGKTYIYVNGFSGGGGTQEDPYLVSTPEDLMAVTGTAHYLQVNDIDLADYAEYDNGMGFPTIARFRGTYDGGNFKIKNLYQNGRNGLFSLYSITDGTITIKNVVIQNCNIIVKEGSAGALVSRNEGTVYVNVNIENCHASGYITGQNVKSGNGNAIGGLIGYTQYMRITVTKCTSSVDINIQTDVVFYVGGLIGSLYYVGLVEYCSTSGNITHINNGGNSSTGGIIGRSGNIYSTRQIIKCKSNARVNGVDNVGGIVGKIEVYASGGTGNISPTTIYDCYTDGGEVKGRDNVGGIVGWHGGQRVERTYSSAIVIAGRQYVGGIIGYGYSNSTVPHASFALCYKIRRTEGTANLFGRIGGRAGDYQNNYALNTIVFEDEEGNETTEFWQNRGTNTNNGGDITDAQSRLKSTYQNVGWLFA